MRGGELWVFFQKSSGFGVEPAATAIARGRHAVTRAEGVAKIDIRGRVFAVSECAAEEAVELRDVAASKVEGSARRAIRACDAAVQVAFDDLDAALDEINAIIEIQCALQEATRGFVLLGWNGEVSVPDG